MEPRSQDVLRRYTGLESLLEILQKERLTLHDPKRWDDENDRNCIEAYVRSNHLKKCFALCFCNRQDLYHYWKIFAGHNEGVCIEFWKKELIKAAKEHNLRHGPMEYLSLQKLEQALSRSKPDASRLPFMKRTAFRYEKEYRFIYDSTADEVNKEVPISLDAIYSIIINPWVDSSGYQIMKDKIEKFTGENIRISQSRLINHEKWLAFTQLY